MYKNHAGSRKIGNMGQSGKTQKKKVKGVSELIKREPINATQNHRINDSFMKEKPAVPPVAADYHRKSFPSLRAARIVAAYLFAFIILDFITQQYKELPGIVTWYPPSGFTYALLLVFGVRFVPAVTLVLFFGSIFIYRMPQSPYLLLLWALVISSIYSAAIAFLHHGIRFDWQLRKLRDVIWFVFTALLVSALLAVLTVSSSAMSSDIPQNELFQAIFHWWIGETVGVLTITPFLLIYVMPWLKKFMEGQPLNLPARRSFSRPTLAVIGQAFSLAFTLYWVFSARVLDEFHPLFLITLPLIWIALYHGFKGITVGIVVMNFGVMLALWYFQSDLTRLGELQLLMIINCIVGLLMGAIVTERRKVEEALRGREAELRALFASMKDLVIIYSKEGRYLNIATTDFQMLIKPPEQLVGKTIHEVLPEDEADRWVGHIQMVLENQKTMPIEYSLEFDHQMIWFNALVSPLNKDSVIWVARDITAQKHVQEETHFLSIHDALTKLYNRTFFEEELSRLEKSRHFPVSIFMIDVDDLKTVNDTQGHPAGDELLQRTARVLLESFRSEDMVARIGGDEFVAILPRTNAEAAQLALKRINHFLELNNKNKPNELKISIGMATSDQQAPLAETVKKADDRMYQDKRSKD
jgi:diguanylate cyclase (GGDEF)-like protein/PAS domain S-box-containing protein